MKPKQQMAPRLAVTGPATLSLLLLLQLLPAFAQPPQPTPAPPLSENEYRIRDLRLRERALDIEEMKARTSLWATGIPISLGLVTLAGTIWAARRTVVAQFTAKAAELSLQGEGPQEIINRATLLADLYEGLLPRKSVKLLRELKPDRLGRLVTQAPWVSELQKEIIALLAQYPEQREQIIADYLTLFPDYNFLGNLQRPNARESTPNTGPQADG